MESEKNLDVPTRHGYLGATKGTICVAKKHKEETMTKYTNAEIANNLSLWNEYFNVSALMTDEEFHTLSYDQRLQMLVEAFGADENEEEEDTMNNTYEEALDILCMYRGDLIPNRYYTMSQTGTASRSRRSPQGMPWRYGERSATRPVCRMTRLTWMSGS